MAGPRTTKRQTGATPTATNRRAETKLQALAALGQSVWLDYLRRGMLRSGELTALIRRGLRGMTSNPTIFEHAIAGSADYDDALARFGTSEMSDREVFEALALDDVRVAADLFRPLYDATQGEDGFVCIEVSPAVAWDAEGTLAEVRRLWAALDRPNVMIKIPGTREACPAIERALTEGINVNVTLLFSVERYRAVAEAHMRALESRLQAGRPVAGIASVASFFVSRVDTEVDNRLRAIPGGAELAGRAAVANARLAYRAFRDLTGGARWQRLAAAGARVQRPLWASTSTKNPVYSDVMYVEALIGPDTVTTVPRETLALFEAHGAVVPTLSADPADATRVMRQLAGAGIDFADATRVLEEEGVAKFQASTDKLLAVIHDKRRALGRAAPHAAVLHAADLAEAVGRRLDALGRGDVPRRIWARDPTVWKDDPATPELADRLAWLTVGEKMAQQTGALRDFAEEIRASFDRVVLCGMGGSSLAADLVWRTFGRRAGFPSLTVLDSTDPRAIAAVDRGGDLRTTLFLISSKSGTTQETLCFFRHYEALTGGAGRRFVASTDPGSPLERLAGDAGFRRTFLNPPDLGGRYAALSYFGLVPAALIGVDVSALLHRAHRMAEACAAWISPRDNPGVHLGALLGEAALRGRDKATFVLSPAISSFGLWVEQLLAESTGKEAKGIIPVVGEPLGPPDVYGPDRVFVALTVAGEADASIAARLDALAAAGHPVVRLTLQDRHDVGAEFFRWELATAVAGAVLGINPFDQPNVAESKANTKRVLAEGRAPSPTSGPEELRAFLSEIPRGHYLAIMAYVPPTPEHDRRLATIRLRLRDRLRVATTLGYGPRLLHSTGQLHKGGPPTGHFVQIIDPSPQEIPIPGEPFGFGVLEAAQAEGDYAALKARGRPVIRVAGLGALET